MENAGCKIGRVASAEAMLKEARSRLCYASPDMVAEKFASGPEWTGTGFDGIEMPAKTLMAIRHVLTTDREDRDGDVLRTAGAELDPKAPVLWQHQPFLPIGKVLKTVEQTKSRLTVVSALLDLNELTSDIATLVEADALRFSHGFRVLDYMPLKDAGGAETGGLDVNKYEILEASLVSVPSNVDAEIEVWSRGKLQSEMMRAHAKAIADMRPVRVSVPVDVKSLDLGHVSDTVVTETQTDKVAEPDNTKAGRVISQKNMDLLAEVKADLDELSGMEMGRPAKALCERSIGKLQTVLDSAKPSEEPEPKSFCFGHVEVSLEDIEPAVTEMVSKAVSERQLELTDVVNYVLGASDDDLARVKHTLDLIFNLAAYNEVGEEYRQFERSIDL
jgi:hypothetical protein